MMVFLGATRTMAMNSAKMRVPLIKFRYGHNRLAGSQPASHGVAATTKEKQSPPNVPHSVGSAVAIDESKLPLRFQRQAIPEDEIEYINRGGPA